VLFGKNKDVKAEPSQWTPRSYDELLRLTRFVNSEDLYMSILLVELIMEVRNVSRMMDQIQQEKTKQTKLIEE
jgi:hypothetical protein